MGRGLLLLAGQLTDTLASRGQLGFLNHHVGNAVPDREFEAAALAKQRIGFEREPRVAWIERAAEDVKQVLTYHV
jgi:hypothetical protein